MPTAHHGGTTKPGLGDGRGIYPTPTVSVREVIERHPTIDLGARDGPGSVTSRGGGGAECSRRQQDRFPRRRLRGRQQRAPCRARGDDRGHESPPDRRHRRPYTMSAGTWSGDPFARAVLAGRTTPRWPSRQPLIDVADAVLARTVVPAIRMQLAASHVPVRRDAAARLIPANVALWTSRLAGPRRGNGRRPDGCRRPSEGASPGQPRPAVGTRRRPPAGSAPEIR